MNKSGLNMEDKKETLPPLNKDSFDGYREEASIHRDQPLPKTCNHKNIQIISSRELKCGCGAGYYGDNILDLYKAFREQ
jgi:hypothetical protein